MVAIVRRSGNGGTTGRGRPAIMAAGVFALLALCLGAAPGALADPLADCQAAYEAGDLAASRTAAEAAVAADAESYTAHWKLARVLIDLGNRAEEKDDRQGLYELAEQHARRAVALREDDTWGHHYLAASVGKLALFHGGKKKIELSKEVRDEAQRAIELDPNNDKSLHIMGRWNREVANLSALKKLAAKVVYGGVPKGASNEKAVEFFQRSIAAAPEHVNHHLELGITYMEMRQYEDAVASFRQALALPDDDPNDPEYKAEARELLEKAERKVKHPRRDKSR